MKAKIVYRVYRLGEISSENGTWSYPGLYPLSPPDFDTHEAAMKAAFGQAELRHFVYEPEYIILPIIKGKNG